MTPTVKTTLTGEEGSIHCTDSVQTLNQRTLLHRVYLKYSETEYWAENKTDSIPGTGYSLKPECMANLKSTVYYCFFWEKYVIVHFWGRFGCG